MHIFEYHILSGENNKRLQERFNIVNESLQTNSNFGKLKVERVIHMAVRSSTTVIN